MPVVLGHPPAVAQPDAEVAVQDADDVIGLPGPEDLPVPGIVTQEADLGEHDGQVSGHGQLPPRVADQDEGGPPAGQQRGRDADLPRVIARAAVQQAGLPDLS
jgi:hypothetical protein